MRQQSTEIAVRHPPDEFDWPHPWELITIESQSLSIPQSMIQDVGERDTVHTLTAELRRECCPDHPLHGQRCVPVARSRDEPDEVVFAVDDSEFPVAFVHLTWAVEQSAEFPYTLRYKSWEEFRVAWTADRE
jgi:hypothetical protein